MSFNPSIVSLDNHERCLDMLRNHMSSSRNLEIFRQTFRIYDSYIKMLEQKIEEVKNQKLIANALLGEHAPPSWLGSWVWRDASYGIRHAKAELENATPGKIKQRPPSKDIKPLLDTAEKVALLLAKLKVLTHLKKCSTECENEYNTLVAGYNEQKNKSYSGQDKLEAQLILQQLEPLLQTAKNKLEEVKTLPQVVWPTHTGTQLLNKFARLQIRLACYPTEELVQERTRLLACALPTPTELQELTGSYGEMEKFFNEATTALQETKARLEEEDSFVVVGNSRKKPLAV